VGAARKDVVYWAQQVIDAFPHDTAPRWLLRNRDAIYGEAFRQRVADMGIGEVTERDSGDSFKYERQALVIRCWRIKI
jgi:hypothetical protein